MKTLARVAAALMLAACGSGRPTGAGTDGALWEPYECQPSTSHLSEQCVAIAREYADAIPSALACSAGEACGALRPVPLQGPGGLEGLCNCPILVNGSRSAALDVALARFITSGCPIGCCPCPPAPPTPGSCPTDGPHPNACG
jgi:hypothetical protein